MFLAALCGFKDCENHENTWNIHAFSGVSGRCFELAGRPCVGANAEDVDTCLIVDLHRSLGLVGLRACLGDAGDAVDAGDAGALLGRRRIETLEKHAKM